MGDKDLMKDIEIVRIWLLISMGFDPREIIRKRP